MRRILFILLLMLSFPLNFAYAELHLVVTKDMTAAVPIAIVPFSNQMQGATENIAQIIQNDLQNSGNFKVMPEGEMQQSPHDISQVNFDYWKQTDNEYLVIGDIKSLGNNQFQVIFSLLNVFLDSDDKSPALQNPIIISKKYIVNENQFRALAHRISDIIYQQITGIRGIFSTKIAYVLIKRDPDSPAQYFLEVADADGYNPKALVKSNAPLMSPAWSPDGSKIAYVSLANQRASINMVDVASGKQQVISAFPGINGAPAWSPDGRKLAIVLSKSGNPNIYVYDLYTHSLQQLTNDMSIDTEPDWSSDGKSIIFTSNRGGGPQIYQYFLANSKIKRLTFDGDYNARAFFVHDSHKIIVLHKDEQGYNIAVQDLLSGELTILTTNGYDSSPSVSPNGQMVIYANDATEKGTLGIVSIDGKIQLTLPAPEGAVMEPAWSPYLS